jgi:hypothetical protein
MRARPPRPQLEPRPRRRGRASSHRPPRAPLAHSSAGAPEAARPPRRPALLGMARQRPRGRPLRAGATSTMRPQAARAPAQRLQTCLTARTPAARAPAQRLRTCLTARTPAALSAAASLPARPAAACAQVRHADTAPGRAVESPCAAEPRPTVPPQGMDASMQSCKQAGVWVSGSHGSGGAADPERAMPAMAAPGAEAPHKPDQLRSEGRTSEAAAADGDADGRGAPSVASPGKRHRAAAAGAPSGDEAVTAHAALGAAEAEARCGAGGALAGEAGAALRGMGVRKGDPRWAAALAYLSAGYAKQVRCSFLGGSWLHPKALCRADCAQRCGESEGAVHAAHEAGHGKLDKARQACPTV